MSAQELLFMLYNPFRRCTPGLPKAGSGKIMRRISRKIAANNL